MKIRVLLISKSEQYLSKIKTMINDEEITLIGESTGGTAALDKVDSTSPDIIVMSFGVGDTDILNLTERIILHKPKTHVILLTEYLDVDLLQSAMKVGAHNVIVYPTSAKEFSDYIKSVYHTESIRVNAFNERQSLSWMSRIITLFGPKGSMGKTTIAVNLAVELAQKGNKVALVDLDLQFGDVSLFMDFDSADTILELMEESFSANIDAVRSFMTIHPSGVHVLSAPRSPEYAEMISGEKVQVLLNLVRTYYDFVIIDSSSSFNEVNLTALEASSLIYFVLSEDDLSVLKNAKLCLSLLTSLQQGDKIKLILNRVDDPHSIGIKDVEEILGIPPYAKLPNDPKTARGAINRGIPFVIDTRNCKLSQAIASMADSLMSGDQSIEIIDIKKKKNSFLIKKSQKKVAGLQ